MNKFDFAERVMTSPVVGKEDFILDMCRGKKVLDLGCVCHDETFYNREDWLHARIKGVAETLLGVDYLQADVEKLQQKGFNVVCADVTREIPVNDEFDVIIAGDLIEHLVNFEAFFGNVTRLLKPGGKVLVSTPNPFFSGEFHYVCFKRAYLINPEHTCWIDPLAMYQLVSRFGYEIDQAHFIEKKWSLGEIVGEGRDDTYDILKGEWSKNGMYSKVRRRLISILFSMIYIPYRFITFQNTKLVRYSDYFVVLKKAD